MNAALRPRWTRPRLALAALALATLAGSLAFGRPLALAVVRFGVSRKFADVPTISAGTLAGWMQGTGGVRPSSPPLVLDVREEREFAVSHLPDARCFPPDAGPEALPADTDPETPIVVYCSVGYRSGLVAERLRAAGFRRVSNLDGSLFAWANDGRPMQDAAGRPTTRVHPYNAAWGRLLAPDHRATPAGGELPLTPPATPR